MTQLAAVEVDTVTDLVDEGATDEAVDEVEELLVEEVSIDGMCGVY